MLIVLCSGPHRSKRLRYMRSGLIVCGLCCGLTLSGCGGGSSGTSGGAEHKPEPIAWLSLGTLLLEAQPLTTM
jgi:hypothetical protein